MAVLRAEAVLLLKSSYWRLAGLGCEDVLHVLAHGRRWGEPLHACRQHARWCSGVQSMHMHTFPSAMLCCCCCRLVLL